MRPARREAAVAWELRGAWAARREVVLVCDGDVSRVRGYVEHVAPTDAFALMWEGAGLAHVPLARVSAVRRPHFDEPLDGCPVTPPPFRVRVPEQLPGQLEMVFVEKI